MHIFEKLAFGLGHVIGAAKDAMGVKSSPLPPKVAAQINKGLEESLEDVDVSNVEIFEGDEKRG
jgi:hypothetical protein